MSIKIQRFDFGTLRDFRGPLVIAPEVEEVAIEETPYVPPPPTFSEAELAAAKLEGRQDGYAEGFEAGLARATEQQDARRIATETIVRNLGEQLHNLRLSYQQLLDSEAHELSRLVHLIAQKVAGEALQNNASEAITALVARCLPVIFSKPRLHIELHPQTFEHAIGPIETLLQTSGFEGEIQFRTNASIGVYDVLLDWGSGSAKRSTATLWQEIEALLASMPVGLAPLDGNADTVIQEIIAEAPAMDSHVQDAIVIDDQTPPTV